ncbi:MAG: hypothetical protein ACTHLE_21045 [Agriterribacter sp.]
MRYIDPDGMLNADAIDRRLDKEFEETRKRKDDYVNPWHPKPKDGDDEFIDPLERRHKNDDDSFDRVTGYHYIAGENDGGGGGGKKKKKEEKDKPNNSPQGYFPAPSLLPGFPSAGRNL